MCRFIVQTVKHAEERLNQLNFGSSTLQGGWGPFQFCGVSGLAFPHTSPPTHPTDFRNFCGVGKEACEAVGSEMWRNSQSTHATKCCGMNGVDPKLVGAGWGDLLSCVGWAGRDLGSGFGRLVPIQNLGIEEHGK